MEVRNWMAYPVRAVKPLDSIQHARELLVTHRVNQLPVIVDDRLVGIVTDRDLRDAFPSVFDHRERAHDAPGRVVGCRDTSGHVHIVDEKLDARWRNSCLPIGDSERNSLVRFDIASVRERKAGADVWTLRAGIR